MSHANSNTAGLSFPNAAWRKSSYSGDQSSCVELAPLPAHVGIRDSKRPAQPALSVRPAAWTAFAAKVRTGGMDVTD